MVESLEDSCNKGPVRSNLREKVFLLTHSLQGNSPSIRGASIHSGAALWWQEHVVELPQLSELGSRMGLKARPGYVLSVIPGPNDLLCQASPYHLRDS